MYNVKFSDGWDKNVLEETNLTNTLSDIQDLSYELNNCVKGCYTGCHTYEDLSAYLINLSYQLKECGEYIGNYKEDTEEKED